MPEGKAAFREVLPKQGKGAGGRLPGSRPGAARRSPATLLFPRAGQLAVEDAPAMVLCKPKVLPLKSVTLEKLEKLQRAAVEAMEAAEAAAAAEGAARSQP
ncbi:BBIP1 protein, partial [Piaya cayana]|nr:BBIP1 protein [Piaya cayana]